MTQIGLFFSTVTGNTLEIAEAIQARHFPPGTVEVHEFEDANAESIDRYPALILGTPTVGDGEYPDGLADFLPELDLVDFSTKTIALFGLGDQFGYPAEFVDALGMLYEELTARGARIVGAWPTDGYQYEASRADQGDGQFCGLVLDQDNQPHLTDRRLTNWIASIKPALLAAG
ncbi:MAG: flavodoxin [Chromatiaceae bacterium]|nr:MAG: flavodoxin [Chromatiaceae bacterium]